MNIPSTSEQPEHSKYDYTIFLNSAKKESEYPYTGYEYAGDKYYDYKYVEEFEDRYAPRKPKEVDYYNWKKIFGE